MELATQKKSIQSKVENWRRSNNNWIYVSDDYCCMKGVKEESSKKGDSENKFI